MELYPFQEKVGKLILSGRSVILQAPTGAGKTRAALAPFVEAFFDFPPDRFPKQCLYTVPMRVLATQFEHEYRGLAESYEPQSRRRLAVCIQTGERPEDPELMGDLVFATLDQVLSSALGVPYSLSPGKANVNVGAVLGSYLVLDEFHLFPPRAMQATLQLLRLFGRFVPFVLMTATFSVTMLSEVAQLLGAEPVLVSAEEVAQIETQEGKLPRKARRFAVREAVINAESILDGHDRRSLAVCNTVDRALDLYLALVEAGCRPVPVTHPALTPLYERLRHAASPEEHRHLLAQAVDVLRAEMADASEETTWVMLLHSRFERPHRQVKEAFLRAECGPQDEEKGQKWHMPSLIVVATQVVEVGLDITSQALHTELASAASVFQRAGRCARYPGEEGQVYLYPVPLRDNGEPNYAPYSSKEEKAICERTWEALCEWNGQVIDFEGEQAVVNFAHQEADRALLQAMREDEGRIWDLIRDGLLRGEASVRRQLIREVDSRTLIVYDAPDGLTEESPFSYEGFSLWHGTLRGAVKRMIDQAEALDLPWALRYPIVRKDEEDSLAPAAYEWLPAERVEDIASSLLFAVHPALVSYDAAQGLCLGLPGDGQYRSHEARPRGGHRENYSYALESYVQHIGAMGRIFEHGFRNRLAWVASRLGNQYPLQKAVRLALALHDVGKLDEAWQRFAVKYQEAIGEDVPSFLVVHTHYEHSNPHHEAALRKVRRFKPATHAGEGAFASARILWEALDGHNYRDLYQAAVTAIARHHSPSLREANPYYLHQQARDTVAEALAIIGDDTWRPWAEWLITDNEAPNLEKRLLNAESPWEGWLFYFIIVRILRLCDGLSQEE